MQAECVEAEGVSTHPSPKVQRLEPTPRNRDRVRRAGKRPNPHEVRAGERHCKCPIQQGAGMRKPGGKRLDGLGGPKTAGRPANLRIGTRPDAGNGTASVRFSRERGGGTGRQASGRSRRPEDRWPAGGSPNRHGDRGWGRYCKCPIRQGAGRGERGGKRPDGLGGPKTAGRPADLRIDTRPDAGDGTASVRFGRERGGGTGRQTSGRPRRPEDPWPAGESPNRHEARGRGTVLKVTDSAGSGENRKNSPDYCSARDTQTREIRQAPRR